MSISTEDLLLIEKSLLRGAWDDKISTSNPVVELAKHVVECRFRDVLQSSQALSLFKFLPCNGDFSFRNILPSTKIYSAEEEVTCLVVAIACLHAFVQANWTGPDLNVRPLDLVINSPGQWTEELLHIKAVEELAYGGEPAYHLSKAPAFLRISELLVSLPYEHTQSIPWWKLRVASVHQRILDTPVVFQEDFRTLFQPLITDLVTESDLAGRIHLELGLFEHTLSHDKIASEYFIKAARSTGLEYGLTGALGKRTKFQATELPQLVLLAESNLEVDSMSRTSGQKTSSEPETRDGTRSTTTFPQTLPLNDDTLLEQTEFTSSQPSSSPSGLSHLDPSSQPPLHPLDQCILLSLCLNVRNTSPSHGLTIEQMNPYVSRVISHPRNWSVHTMALLLRSRLESSRTRTMERSTLQLQALIDQMPTSDSTTAERLLYFHSIPLPSRWEMERELARRYLSLGVIQSALEIFERLEMWEDVVQCFGALEKPERGIAIVRDLLEGRKEEADAVLSRGKATSIPRKKMEDITREAKFWCLLGDLEPVNAINHYMRAWNVSNQTSGRAMRSLGGCYFARGMYQEAIDCLKKAVNINPLLAKSWFILGCAAMRVEEWEEAKIAFGRCVTIDEEDGESWSNLASMYLQIGEKQTKKSVSSATDLNVHNALHGGWSLQVEVHSDGIPFENKLLAFRALKQGLRYSYDNWRMWDNYMVVAIGVGELQEACRALSRVVELTADKVGIRAVDEDVLARLVDSVIKAPQKAEETEVAQEVQNPNEGRGLYKNVLLLLEQTILQRFSSPRIFRAYARLLSWQNQWEDAIKAYLDAYRCSDAGSLQSGETDIEKWRVAVGEVEEIVDILRNFGPRITGYKWRLQGRSIIRTFIGRSRDFEDEAEWKRLVALRDELRKLDDED